jgi:ABC-2 type transport system ATP-binding protein
MITLESVSKRYGAKTVVDNVSFTVDQGEVLGFLGPNGAGKTTTLRMIGGCITATSGRVTVAGYDMATHHTQAARRIGYLPERPPLYDTLDVASYLKFVARVKEVPRRRMASELERVTTACRLEEVFRREIFKLSKGYRQRVGLAQALLGNPELLLLDEPTIGLDPAQIQETRDVIRAFGEGHTVMLSTHILHEVTLICHRVAIIHQGRLLAIDTPEGLQRAVEQTHVVMLQVTAPAEALNPAQARMMGVQFAGTAILQSEDRQLQVHGQSETDIANGILRVSQGAKQLICFLDGHGEADPFSLESHDHLEGTADHSHGLGAQYVLRERHGLAKARHGLEALNYQVEKVSLIQRHDTLSTCALLIVAGPKTALLPAEVEAIQAYLATGGNGFFMLDPFVTTGLEPVVREYGIVLDDTIVIDRASHYWADISAPAVTSYNRHQITRDLPLTFYPGVRSLSPTPQRVPGMAVVPLVNSSKNSYGETDPGRAQFAQHEDLPGPATLMAIVNRRPITPGSAATASLSLKAASPPSDAARAAVSARSRLAVVGDADFATNSFFHVLGNGNLFLNTVNYLVAQENLIGIEPRTYDLPRLNMTNRQLKGTFFLSVILMPAVLALLGLAVWWRQR